MSIEAETGLAFLSLIPVLAKEPDSHFFVKKAGSFHLR